MTRYTDEELERQVFEDVLASEGKMVRLLRRPPSTPDGAGGWIESTTPPRPLPHRRRIITAVSVRASRGEMPTYHVDDTGERHEVRYVMLGPVGDDVQENDRLEWKGEQLRVAEVHPDRTFQTRAELVHWSDGS